MTQPHVDADLVDALARLAGLEISSSDRQEMIQKLEDVLQMIDSLQAVDVSGYEPMLHPPMATQPLRADAPGATLSAEQIEAIAIDLRDGAFAVPKVLEQ